MLQSQLAVIKPHRHHVTSEFTQEMESVGLTQWMPPLCDSLGINVLWTLNFLSQCHWCKLGAKLLPCERQLRNENFILLSSFSTTILGWCSVTKNQACLVLDKENKKIKTIYAAVRRQTCQLHSALPVCKCSRKHLKAPQPRWEL